MPQKVRAIDPWVNVDSRWDSPPDWLTQVQKEYIKSPIVNKQVGRDELVHIMDEAGVERSIITIYPHKVPESTLEFVNKYPERFALCVDIDPSKLMPEVRRLEMLVNELPVVMARIVPFALDIASPPSHAHYYPFYAKCVELDLPISINTGICGPVRLSVDCQNPIHLDQVCFDFPDLKITMAHGADPWWDIAIRLMIKYKNLRLMTSAYSPKYLPSQLIHFMKTRGKNKIMWASDFPIMFPKPLIEQALQLELGQEALDNYLYNNAYEFFFKK